MAGSLSGSPDRAAARRQAERLTVLSVAYPFAPVTRDSVGGAEQVLAAIDRGLTRAGHRSVVVAAEGSTVSGELWATPHVPEAIDDQVRERIWSAVRGSIAAALSEIDVDVIHLHGIDFDRYLPPPGPPVLATLHLPPDWYAESALHPDRPDTFLNCVSETQRRRCPSDAPIVATIPNGVDLRALRPSAWPKGRYALALGRICPEKGYALALEAAAVAQVSLLIAGHTYPYPEHLRYLHEQIEPKLGARARLLRPVRGEAKRRLLARARCLVVPSLVEETSSLVAREALACGTPVVAFARGALPEIVEDGVNGFLVSDVAGMADALERSQHLDPAACRRTAEERADLQDTVANYLRTYGELVARRHAAHAASA